MRRFAGILIALLCVTSHVTGAQPDYKQVLIATGSNSVRVRLPLTDVTGKVRVKERNADGIGLPLAPTKTPLGKAHYLEWQIGYDTPTTNSPTLVREIQFTRNGQTKYGHELSKIIFEALRIGVLSTNDLLGELAALKQIPPEDFEENQPLRVETDTNRAPAGFQRTVQRVPQFTKTTPHGWVQIQLKAKQRAVGFQAMVYVCLPMTEVLTPDGTPRPASRAASKETVCYDFTREKAAFLLDIVQAFGLASQPHNDDMRTILGKILDSSASR